MRYGVAGDTSSFFFFSAYKSDSPQEALSVDIRVYRSRRLSRRFQDPQCEGLCQIPDRENPKFLRKTSQHGGNLVNLFVYLRGLPTIFRIPSP